jgi:hypothetical protein
MRPPFSTTVMSEAIMNITRSRACLGQYDYCWKRGSLIDDLLVGQCQGANTFDWRCTIELCTLCSNNANNLFVRGSGSPATSCGLSHRFVKGMAVDSLVSCVFRPLKAIPCRAASTLDTATLREHFCDSSTRLRSSNCSVLL